MLRPHLSLQLMVSNADMKTEFEKQGIDILYFEERLRQTVSYWRLQHPRQVSLTPTAVVWWP